MFGLQDGYANEEESESKEYEVTPPRNRSRRQRSYEVGSRSAERKRHKPLSELSSGQDHSHEYPVKMSTRHSRSVPERTERRTKAWLREHSTDEELAGPSRSVSRVEPQLRAKSKRQKNNKQHDMDWESDAPSKGGRQGLRSDASAGERPLRIKVKCVENTTKREEEEDDEDDDELPEENSYRRGKPSRVSARNSQRQNHVQKEKEKAVEVKVGLTQSVTRGGLRAPRQQQNLRKIESAAWLLMSEVDQGHYTPQFGDEVAYVQQV